MEKSSQLVLVLALALPASAAVACGSTSSSEPGGEIGHGGRSGAQGGSNAQGGAINQAGASAPGGSTSLAGAGGSGSSGGSATGGASTGGTNSAAGATGSSAGNHSGGGATAGASNAAGQGGTAQAGSNGLDIAKDLDGLRVDDPCTGTPDTSNGAVCNHVTLTAGGFKSAKEVTIAGTPGTTYDVTLRIRGIVEPTQIDGGMRPDTTTFQYQNMTWRKVPFTIGGTVNRGDYSQWRLTVASPKQEYFLNDYQTVGHYIFKLDYQVTLQMAANSKVTLDGYDSNERQIVNYEKYTFDGIPGSMNYGQFIQCNVVSVKPH